MKKFEILNSLPPYGPMYISITANGEPDYSEGFVVRFFKLDGTNWVANFKHGWTDLEFIHEFLDNQTFLVVARGLCYYINPENHYPLRVFGCDYIAKFETDDGRLILMNSTSLTIIEPYTDHWRTERISWDGMKEVSLKENIISGLAFDATDSNNEWKEFTYNIDTKTLTGGSYPIEKPKKKSWWKT